MDNFKYGLFLHRRFMPIFLATFLGAFNDNLLRSGLVVLIAYSVGYGIYLPTRPEILVTVCSAILVLPMILFSYIAGQVADKYEKSRMVLIAKIAELGIMLGAYHGFATQNIYLLMLLLFFSGTHTTFYSPIKFSILPDHLKSRELLAGNGFMAGGSYLAMLFGMITGGFLVDLPGNTIGTVAMTIALAGLLASFFVPKATIAHPECRIHWNMLRGTLHIIDYAMRDKTVLRTVLSLSWFLLVGSVYMSQFANYAQGVVHANNEVYILFLTGFSVGIAFGSTICDTLLKGEITARLAPWAALGISIFTALMVYFTPLPTHSGLLGVSEFVSLQSHWPLLVCMVMVAVCGGMYIVPLYALLQSRSDMQYRSRIMAASNLSDSVFATLAAVVSALLLMAGLGITDLFIILAFLNLGVIWYTYRIGGGKRER